MSAKSSISFSPSKSTPVITLSAEDAAKRTKSDKAKYYASIAAPCVIFGSAIIVIILYYWFGLWIPAECDPQNASDCDPTGTCRTCVEVAVPYSLATTFECKSECEEAGEYCLVDADDGSVCVPRDASDASGGGSNYCAPCETQVVDDDAHSIRCVATPYDDSASKWGGSTCIRGDANYSPCLRCDISGDVAKCVPQCTDQACNSCWEDDSVAEEYSCYNKCTFDPECTTKDGCELRQECMECDGATCIDSFLKVAQPACYQCDASTSFDLMPRCGTCQRCVIDDSGGFSGCEDVCTAADLEQCAACVTNSDGVSSCVPFGEEGNYDPCKVCVDGSQTDVCDALYGNDDSSNTLNVGCYQCDDQIGSSTFGYCVPQCGNPVMTTGSNIAMDGSATYPAYGSSGDPQYISPVDPCAYCARDTNTCQPICTADSSYNPVYCVVDTYDDGMQAYGGCASCLDDSDCDPIYEGTDCVNYCETEEGGRFYCDRGTCVQACGPCYQYTPNASGDGFTCVQITCSSGGDEFTCVPTSETDGATTAPIPAAVSLARRRSRNAATIRRGGRSRARSPTYESAIRGDENTCAVTECTGWTGVCVDTSGKTTDASCSFDSDCAESNRCFKASDTCPGLCQTCTPEIFSDDAGSTITRGRCVERCSDSPCDFCVSNPTSPMAGLCTSICNTPFCQEVVDESGGVYAACGDCYRRGSNTDVIDGQCSSSSGCFECRIDLLDNLKSGYQSTGPVRVPDGAPVIGDGSYQIGFCTETNCPKDQACTVCGPDGSCQFIQFDGVAVLWDSCGTMTDQESYPALGLIDNSNNASVGAAACLCANGSTTDDPGAFPFCTDQSDENSGPVQCVLDSMCPCPSMSPVNTHGACSFCASYASESNYPLARAAQVQCNAKSDTFTDDSGNTYPCFTCMPMFVDQCQEDLGSTCAFVTGKKQSGGVAFTCANTTDSAISPQSCAKCSDVTKDNDSALFISAPSRQSGVSGGCDANVFTDNTFVGGNAPWGIGSDNESYFWCTNDPDRSCSCAQPNMSCYDATCAEAVSPTSQNFQDRAYWNYSNDSSAVNCSMVLFPTCTCPIFSAEQTAEIDGTCEDGGSCGFIFQPKNNATTEGYVRLGTCVKNASGEEVCPQCMRSTDCLGDASNSDGSITMKKQYNDTLCDSSAFRSRLHTDWSGITGLTPGSGDSENPTTMDATYTCINFCSVDPARYTTPKGACATQFLAENLVIPCSRDEDCNGDSNSCISDPYCDGSGIDTYGEDPVFGCMRYYTGGTGENSDQLRRCPLLLTKDGQEVACSPGDDGKCATIGGCLDVQYGWE